MTALSLRRPFAVLTVSLFVVLTGCRVPAAQNSTAAERAGAKERRDKHQTEGAAHLSGTTSGGGTASSDPGALIALSMDSTVGILLDEVPAAMRDRVAQTLLAQNQKAWVDRAKQQIRLAAYRLVFRNYFYRPGKMQLPLPPEDVWNVAVTGAAYRETTSQHDTVMVKYRFQSMLLTTPESPAKSEPGLGVIGGTWEEPFVFPVDPEMLMQRTGYACIDEAEFPNQSVDSEEVDSFYDQDCKPEKEASLAGCHQSSLPKKSCQQALRDSVGSVATKLKFTRLAWDANTASQVRIGAVTTDKGADLTVVESEFRTNRVVYKYIEPNGCEIVEQCVGGPGWRKLIQFATTDQNVGNRTLDIGAIDYYLTGEGGQTLNDQYKIFEFSACHKHYHFTHYGSFELGGNVPVNAKRGFCLQSTARFSNNETSPLYHPYGGCEYQGVSAGWVDQYKIGLPCQWVDVTTVDTSKGEATLPLTFRSNPDGFLCEGKPVLDANGNPVFEPTAFKAADGSVVSRAKCEFIPNWDANNTHTYDVTVPVAGEGYVTKACERGQIGPLRNCGFKAAKTKITCTPGQPTTFKCSVPGGSAPQVARLCEYSHALKTGVPCTFDASLASATVSGTNDTVTLTCPAARGPGEPGGAVALYTGPVFDKDAEAKVTCVQ